MNSIIRECYAEYTKLKNEMERWLKQSMLLDPPGPQRWWRRRSKLCPGVVSTLSHHWRCDCSTALRYAKDSAARLGETRLLPRL